MFILLLYFVYKHKSHLIISDFWKKVTVKSLIPLQRKITWTAVHIYDTLMFIWSCHYNFININQLLSISGISNL